MKYNIIKLEQKPKGSVHCSALRSNDQVETYESRFLANQKIDKLKTNNPSVKYIISKHWR